MVILDITRKNPYFPRVNKTLPFLVTIALAQISTGATLLSSSFATDSSTNALPSTTGSDWAYWNSSPNATNTSGLSSRIFTVSPFGATAASLLTSGQPATTKFTYTNGEVTPNTNTTAFSVGGIRNNLVATTAVGNGIQMTLDSFTQTSRIQLWTYNFIAGSTLNVYLNGSSTVAYTQTVAGLTSGKQGYLYTFDFEPTAPTDSIRFVYIQNSGPDINSNVGFQAISITPIPEASSVALLGLGCATGLLRRRR